MMKKKTNNPLAVIITDTHLSDKNIPLVKDIFKQTFEYCRDNNIKYLFHAGDWFTSRTGQSIACLMATKEIIEQMSRQYGLEMYIIAGNHDKADQSISESFLNLFENMPGFRLITLAGGLPILPDKINVNMIPFYTPDVYNDELQQMNAFLFEDPEGDHSAKQILITHIAVNGVKNNDGSEVTTGYSPNLFKNFHSVFVGHYHNKGKVGKNIYYIGSAYQANFGEDTEKGITVLYEDGSHKQVKLVFPEYVKFYIDVKSINAKDIKELELIKKEHPLRQLRIVLQGTEEEIKSFNKSVLEDIGISVESKPNDIVLIQDQEEIETVSYNKDNLLQAFDEFCTYKNIENEYARTILAKL